MGEVVKLGRYGRPGYFAAQDLPQHRPIDDVVFSAGWWELDQIFKFYPKQFTVVTGMAGSGKSTFLLNIIANLARNHGMASVAYIPENEAYLYHKMRKIYGETDEKFSYFMSELFFVQSAEPEHYNSEPQTLEWVLDHACAAVEKDHVEIVLIDPWNELERSKPRDELMTDFIGRALMYLKQFCRAMGVSVIMVAHPTKAANEGAGRIPRLSDIEGSMNWFNKCDNGLIVHRESDKPVTKVISAKVREAPAAGKLGECYFDVDPVTGIFKPQYGAVGEAGKGVGFAR